MSANNAKRDSAQIDRLLAGAAKTMGNVRYCWLATAAEAGGVHVRPMGRLIRDLGEKEWTVSFVTDGRSRKAADIRRAGKVAIVFQDDPNDAFVALSGTATLRSEAAEVRRRWKRAYDAYFPSETDRANAIFVEIDVERMELWIRGVTPEPFGLQTTRLERDAGSDWRLVAENRDAA